ncbi:MAG: hypothetical protein FWD52_05065 [Candidatus Bathyarchaeota archaeon]|nr:hypothetical protein [Candidatus Termiticorpusculum sp.]
MSKEPMHSSSVSIGKQKTKRFNLAIKRWKKTWEHHGYAIIIAILVITPIVAWFIGFGRIDTISFSTSLDEKKEELARLLVSISFPMTGVLLFVLGQSLTYREKYRGKIGRLVTAYHYIGVISGITVVGSAIIGLLSMQYFKSGGDTLLVSALCLLLSILVLLIINTISFCIYTMTKEDS